VVTGVVTIGLNILLSILLVGPMEANGLALAYSISGFFNMLALIIILKIKLGRLDGRRLIKSFMMSLGISALMYLVARESAIYVANLLNFTPKLNELVAILVAVAIGTGVYVGGSLVLKMEEAQLILRLLGRRLPFLRRL
jgi:putative peptidoglycan lipid II flippase